MRDATQGARALLHALVLVVAAACSSGDAPGGADAPAGYAVRARFDLAPEADATSGRLELLEDARIRPEMREAIREAWGGDPCAELHDAVLEPLCAATRDAPLRPAMLRLLDADGRVVATRAAERPLADLEATEWRGPAQRAYVFTVDQSTGAGSYSGPVALVAEPDAKGFGWAVASDAKGGAADTLALVTTLKSAWRAVPRADGRGAELLVVRCRPDFAPAAASPQGGGFVVTFERFAHDGTRWVRHRRQAPGCWEDDGDASFPARARFP
jgi:hypothetical protein